VIVVADTTPLLYLSRIARLDIARDLYCEVLVPREVHEELVEKRPDADGVEDLRAAKWIVVVDAPGSIPADESTLATLDAGEAAALRLAFERRALVLIDERAGRRAAYSLGLAVRGTLGMLVEAPSHAGRASPRPRGRALCGGHWDNLQTGLIYVGGRYYSPQLGRFLSEADGVLVFRPDDRDIDRSRSQHRGRGTATACDARTPRSWIRAGEARSARQGRACS
jgi:predicted nucleic acid-binding protein